MGRSRPIRAVCPLEPIPTGRSSPAMRFRPAAAWMITRLPTRSIIADPPREEADGLEHAERSRIPILAVNPDLRRAVPTVACRSGAAGDGIPVDSAEVGPSIGAGKLLRTRAAVR